MKNKIIEESILFISVFKWIIISSGIGIVIGIATALFLKILQACISFTSTYPRYFYLLPFGLFLSSLMVRYLAKDAGGYGTEKVIESIHKHSGIIRSVVIPVKLAATVITATVGGSIGQIGPCAQIGGGMASYIADLLKFDENDRKKMVICGISAGFASVLGAPIAGAIFGVEILFVGSILYEVLLPSFISGIVSYHTASYFGLTYFHYSTHIMPAFSEALFIKIVLAGIFFGLCAIAVIETMRATCHLFDKIRIWAPIKGILGGVILIMLAHLFSPRYLGLGLDTVQEVLKGGVVAPYAFLAKTVFTALTFATGGTGGIIAPLIFVGATAGSFLGKILMIDHAAMASVGFVSVLAGAANAPIAMSILAIELFGGDIGAYAAVACVISFLITGHRSIFPTQVMAMKKSSSVAVQIGAEMDGVHVHYYRRSNSLIDKILVLLEKTKRTRNKNHQ